MRIGAGEVAGIAVGRVLEVLHPLFALAPCPALEHNVAAVREHLQAFAHARLVDARGDIEALIEQDDSTYAAVCGPDVAEARLLHKEPAAAPSAADHIRAEVVAPHAAIALKAAEEIAARLARPCRARSLQYDALLALDAQPGDE